MSETGSTHAGEAALARLRATMPVLQERTYLFAGAMAPLADPVREELASWNARWGEDPMSAFNQHVEDGQRLRTAFAALVGSTPDRIAILGSTSEGSNRIIGMLASEPRPTVLVDDTTFPTMIYPWLTKTGKQIEYSPPEQLSDGGWLRARLAKGDVLAVAVSHVGNTNGYRHDVAEVAALARAYGTRVLVDAAQSAGAIPIDVDAMGIDVLTTTALKWLLGPPGIGLFYLSAELQEHLPLTDVGYLQAQISDNVWPRTEVPNYPTVASSLELGIPAIPCLAAAAAGIELLSEIGVGTIAGRIEHLMGTLLPALRDRGLHIVTPDDPARRGGVISARYPRSAELGRFLAARRIDIGGFPGGTVRIDPHGYNDEGDVERLLDGVDRFLTTSEGQP